MRPRMAKVMVGFVVIVLLSLVAGRQLDEDEDITPLNGMTFAKGRR